ncbi:bifunctional demethylmenaquinone methyltransferase/2-methoxy-6-polyprenyl-1,4-benzoquinol methylase UbiE [candidate division KSB3 bacterium]|uniref:Demethylmenaquinone methyltransferase n=1 Tax=candidate division KSB3 bacterium TaxID=2044937 RepID=A0A9D5K048_9BACT|nr:bifunctional demethylmenaquinone methyltransferase/2-methoxy-6-polyprenyl-1,4-benzoquinol methylase UbiE [candidate division KSB3 bacterium]MBD3327454.1 bifunctional demethylmenaquinone methyltransferase/2-methoxy-6-polyprenyl-1,4-benzoquinol methylase UbiE [candidate division KSB3 bacterium]
MTPNLNSLFNDIAPTYDLLNRLFSFMCDRRWRNRAIQAVTIPPDAVVLDVCTGTADIALAIAARQPDCRVYGIDFSGNMLAHGQRKCASTPLATNIQLIQADALHLPFSDHACHTVFLSFGLRNLRERDQGLREISRVLQPQGQIAMLEFCPPPPNLFGKVYRLYLGTLIPFIGKIVSKSSTAYHYLHTSIAEFPEPAAIITLLQATGFGTISWKPLMMGIVALYVATKPEPNLQIFRENS